MSDKYTHIIAVRITADMMRFLDTHVSTENRSRFIRRAIYSEIERYKQEARDRARLPRTIIREDLTVL